MLPRQTRCFLVVLIVTIAAGLTSCGDDGGSRSDSELQTCDFTPDPALAANEPDAMAGMVARHNYWRQRVGVPRVSWNLDLADSATEYARRCVFEHADNPGPDGGFDAIGENLAVTSQTLEAYGVQTTVDAWAGERQYWNLGMTIGDGNFHDYGHYTQVVWESTTEIGCGAAQCSSVEGVSFGGTMIVCRYGPAGNYVGEPPYRQAEDACLDLDNDDARQQEDADDTDREIQ